jgi:hypothetical protein
MIYAISNMSFSPYSSYFISKQASSWQAIQMDPEFAKNIGQIVLLGGSFAVNGNANPAAEANVSIFILYSTS